MRRVLIAALLITVSGACGTRVDGARQPTSAAAPSMPGGMDSAPVIADQTPAASSVAAGAQAGSATETAQPSTAARPTGTAAPASPAAWAAQAGGPGQASSPKGSGGKSAPSAGTSSSPQRSTVTTGTVPPAGATPGSGVKSPVIIATVGTFSGPVGNVLLPVLNGAQIWTKHINSRGGLNGHPVNLVVYDDAGDPARHRSQVQDAVERRKAIAFLANPETLAGRQSVEYINQKRVPVVGDGGGMSWVYESPMYFTQQSNGDAMFYSFIASPADINVPKGKKKLGTLVCVEAPDCDPADKIMSGAAKRLGFEHVYRGRASVAQPDYTAECLSARNGGVEVFLVLLDRLSLGRVAAACARQGFRPTFAHVATAQGDDSKKDPNLEGLSASSNVFPYFQSGTPASDEFQAALRSYSGAVSLGIGTATGWTAGKLLEKAAAKLPEPPTSQAILEGLWSIKNDDLGGLTLPLTFQESGPTKPTSTCWFNMVVRKSEWTTPDGYRLRCVSMT